MYAFVWGIQIPRDKETIFLGPIYPNRLERVNSFEKE
jgi:hypothetical protein